MTEVLKEKLAKELHKFFRAANISNQLGKSRMHDHGWSLCSNGAKNYIRKRATKIIEDLKLNDNSK